MSLEGWTIRQSGEMYVIHHKDGTGVVADPNDKTSIASAVLGRIARELLNASGHINVPGVGVLDKCDNGDPCVVTTSGCWNGGCRRRSAQQPEGSIALIVAPAQEKK